MPDAGASDEMRLVGVLCSAPSGCASGICLPIGRCSKTCTAPTDCPNGPTWTCAPEEGLGQVCTCAVTPDAVEVCDGIDNDCDGLVDNGPLCQNGEVCRAAKCDCPLDRRCAADGACVDTTADVNHCSMCGKQCTTTAANAAPACRQSECGYDCQKGFGDCDGDRTNGCERNFGSDPANCGACGANCLGGICATNACQAVAFNVNCSSTTVNSRYVYWTNDVGLYRAAINASGGTGELVTAATRGTPRAIAASETTVYWFEGGVVLSIPVNAPLGTAPTVLVQNEPSGVGGITVTSTSLYWVRPTSNIVAWALSNAPLVAPVSLRTTTSPLAGLAADATHIYWAERPDGAAQTAPGSIYRAGLASGAPAELIAKDVPSVNDLAVTDEWVYWTDATQLVRWAKKDPTNSCRPCAVGMGSGTRSLGATATVVTICKNTQVTKLAVR